MSRRSPKKKPSSDPLDSLHSLELFLLEFTLFCIFLVELYRFLHWVISH
jgi:hypothetical protein